MKSSDLRTQRTLVVGVCQRKWENRCKTNRKGEKMTEQTNLELKGVVEQIEKNEEKGYSRLKIAGLFYTAFKEAELGDIKQGDYVEGTYIEKPNPNNTSYPYKNIVSLEAKPMPKGFQEKQDVKELMIVRQACFKAACSAFEFDMDLVPEKQISAVIALAKAGEAYIYEGIESTAKEEPIEVPQETKVTTPAPEEKQEKIPEEPIDIEEEKVE